MKAGFIYADVFLRHETPQTHPERSERLISVLNALRASAAWGELLHFNPRKACFADIELAHCHEYVKKVKNFGAGYIDPDTYISGESLKAALYAAGAVMEAVDRCSAGEIDRAFCAVRPPGHHAETDRAMGFCIFNNIAVGARYAQRKGYKKVFIADFDVHHGNGTQHIFEDDDTVFYFSTHQYPHYPGTGSASERGTGKGKGFTYNIPMSSGAGDEAYLAVYDRILPDLVKGFNPDIIMVSAGYDIHRDDPLSSIMVSYEGIRGIVKSILSSSRLPVVFALEGGYDLTALSGSVLITIEEMLKG